MRLLNVVVYEPINVFFEIEVNTFQKTHPGRIFIQYDVVQLFIKAYLTGATPANADFEQVIFIHYIKMLMVRKITHRQNYMKSQKN